MTLFRESCTHIEFRDDCTSHESGFVPWLRSVVMAE